MAHEPHAEASSRRSLQLAPQAFMPLGHSHALPTQVASAGHCLPQLAQFFGSDARSTQPLTPLQNVAPATTHVQLPALHSEADEHATSHPPQCIASVDMSTHRPAHVPFPVGHAHVPLMHVAPIGHAWPHSPQFFGSLDLSTQPAPLHDSWPEGQNVQLPRSHVALPIASMGHSTPHPPQSCASASVFVQRPLQSSGYDSGHTQAPPRHFASSEQRVRQLPHASGSVCKSRQVAPHCTHGVSVSAYPPSPRRSLQPPANELMLAIATIAMSAPR